MSKIKVRTWIQVWTY